MSKYILTYVKLFLLSFVGAMVLRIWMIFISMWIHGDHYQWGWVDVKFILVKGGLLTVLFWVTVTIGWMKNRS